jgi:hypothetical protein
MDWMPFLSEARARGEKTISEGEEEQAGDSQPVLGSVDEGREVSETEETEETVEVVKMVDMWVVWSSNGKRQWGGVSYTK